MSSLPIRNGATPEQRSSRARAAALIRWSKEDGVAGAAAATAASPAKLGYWERKVDPDLVLDEPERIRRAQRAKTAHFIRLGVESGKARRARSKRVS